MLNYYDKFLVCTVVFDNCLPRTFHEREVVLLLCRMRRTTSFVSDFNYLIMGLAAVLYLLCGTRGETTGAVGCTGENRRAGL